ncbi:MAG TPA: hypothetical protein V6C99_01235 [Oculatellaceae cyanobacterium]|jgi:hypothetical protein
MSHSIHGPQFSTPSQAAKCGTKAGATNFGRPVGASTTSATTHVVRKAAISTPARVLLSALAIFGGYAMCKDSINGTRLKRKGAISAHHIKAQYEDMAYGWGKYSGHPWMDQQAHKFKRFMLYGPMNLRMQWESLKIRVNSYVNDVFLPNLLPITMMVGGVVGLLGFRNIKNGMRASGRFVRNNIRIPSSFKSQMQRSSGKLLQSTAKGLGKMLSFPFKSPTHLGLTAAGALFGLFFLQRFNKSYGNAGQQEYFRDFVTTKK